MAPYERLLSDAMRGDATLFASEDSVEAAWRVVDPVLDDVTPVYHYEPNTWGPREADALVAGEGGWHNPQVKEVKP
jgi:glucose-6-phosphate 1-dehydrogenase